MSEYSSTLPRGADTLSINADVIALAIIALILGVMRAGVPCVL